MQTSHGDSALEGGPGVYDKAELTYNDYLKIPQLLSLQHPLSDPPNHDETLFIIIHQAYELWFKQILHELEAARAAMQADQILAAHHYVGRVAEILKVLVAQIKILETMAPGVFLEFRDRLNPASGFQSLQFRELEFLGGIKDPRYMVPFKNKPEYIAALERRMREPDLNQTYLDMLRRSGFAERTPMSEVPPDAQSDPERTEIIRALIAIYGKPHDHLPIYLLSEALLDFDEHLAQWRWHHVLMVERIIGMRPGTGGSSGVDYLQRTITKRCFPQLWEVRGFLKKPDLAAGKP